MTVPAAIRPLVGFPSLLRANGFLAAPDQTIGFVEAVALLGPRHIGDVRRAARALFAIPRDREPLFDQLFDAHFLGRAIAVPAEADPDSARADDEDTTAWHVDQGREADVELGEREPTGQQAAVEERLGHRAFPAREDSVLDRFVRRAPTVLPRRASFRFRSAARGLPDRQRTLREAVRRGGEALTLSLKRRRHRQRRIVFMVDVSGSMKAHTDSAMRFAHALRGVAPQAEIFTFGTRLTRVTPALDQRDRERALERISGLVADIDGGTRIGEALTLFLSTPRLAGLARGAILVILSDGLERGDPAPMTEAVRQLSRIAWRLVWLSPLAADPDFSPETGALALARPWIDVFGDGSSTEAMARHFLDRAWS